MCFSFISVTCEQEKARQNEGGTSFGQETNVQDPKSNAQPQGEGQSLLTRRVLGHKEDKSNSSLNYVKGKVRLSPKSKEGETRCRSF